MFEFALSANYLHSLYKDLDAKDMISDRSQWDRILKNVYDRFFCENASQPIELINMVSSANADEICRQVTWISLYAGFCRLERGLKCYLIVLAIWNPATWVPLATGVEVTQPTSRTEILQELRSELHDALRTVTESSSPYSNDLLKRNQP